MEAAMNDELHWLSTYRDLFSSVGLALEVDRDAWKALWEMRTVRSIAYMDVPLEFNPYPFESQEVAIGGCPYSIRLAIVERLSQFDASALLALPSPSMCASLVSQFGGKAQQRYFYEHFQSLPSWAFFAATEAEVGSDLSSVSTTLSRKVDHFILNGTKTLVGNANVASVGIVLAHRSEDLQPVFVFIEPNASTSEIEITPLETLGLSGLGLSRVSIRNYRLQQEQILGTEKEPIRFGVAALGKLLLRHRPLVAAMALGTAHGLLDLLVAVGVQSTKLMPLQLELLAHLRRMQKIGSMYEISQLCSHDASLFKFQATDFARRVASLTVQVVSPRDFLSIPAINKKFRDALAFEYMEGTQNIHKLNAFNSFLAGVRLDPATHNLG